MKREEVVGIIIFIAAFVLLTIIAVDRFEKINNGEMTIASQNEMDR